MGRKTLRKALSLAAAAALTLSLSVPGFAADSAFTRAEMVAQLIEAAGLNDQAASAAAKTSAFQDVAEGSTYEGCINLAYENGWISGSGDNCFSPDRAATQMEAVTVLLKYAKVPAALTETWPVDYAAMAANAGLTDASFNGSAAVSSEQFAKMLEKAAALAGKPYIGITWKSNEQNYDSFKTVIRAAGGIPVELKQVTSNAVSYNPDNSVASACLEETGMLKQEFADQIKAKDLSKSNAADVMKAINGVFFTGGEDISPSLYATPQKEDNNGEEINATRDISDYTLMAYCFANDVPTFAACRGMQMMSIVSGSGFIQDIPNYYKANGKTYDDTHRMPPDAPNRTYARHDVEVLTEQSRWLYDVVGGDKLEKVSSWHHQGLAPKDLEGTDLTMVSKTTVDGLDIVEGVEKQGQTFCLGVQFHPENDCANALHNNNPDGALCDVDICLTFFETLVGYAADKPLIGISWGGDPADYVDMQDIVRNVGGVVTHLPQIKDYDGAVAALERVDGVLVTGGEDINPDLYKEEHSPLLEDNNEQRDLRDTSDYNLIKAALAKDKAMLVICRGMQMFNVVCGGGLIQDLPTYLNKSDAEYKVHRNKPNWARHEIKAEANSKWLSDIIGGTELADVASWHHQVANPERIGEGLTVVAYGPDQVIEAMEYQANNFALGVQFHPEADALGGEDAVCNPTIAANFFGALVNHAK